MWQYAGKKRVTDSYKFSTRSEEKMFKMISTVSPKIHF